MAQCHFFYSDSGAMPMGKMAIPNIGVMIVFMSCLFIEILRESDIDDKRLSNRINSKDGV